MAIRYNQFALVAAPPGTSGAVVDDPVIKTAGFTAKPGVRYFISAASLPFTMTMPSSPTEGMLVGVTKSLGGAGILTITGSGTTIGVQGANGSPSLTVGAYSMNLLFRYVAAFAVWHEVGFGLASFLNTANTSPAVFTRAVGFNGLPDTLLLPSADGVPGRVESGSIQELRPYNQAHNLYNTVGAMTDASVGSQSTWLNSVAWQRAHMLNWEGASDLIVRGVFANKNGAEWRNDKVIHNATDPSFFGGNRNIIWKLEDTGAGDSTYRLSFGAAVPSTDFGEYVQGPGQTVRLRYNTTYDRWFIQGERSSGYIDRGVATTNAVATIIHTHQTNLANRVIAYKVQVEALETVGTPGRAALYDIAALFHRDGAGTVVQKGATAFLATIEDNAAWDVTFTISGTTIQMKVTGDGTDTVQWRVVGNITEHG
jgi:hypothetical protein